MDGKINRRDEKTRRRSKQLPDDLKKLTLHEFERGALYHTFWRSHFGRDYGPITRQTMQRMNSLHALFFSK